MKIVETKNKQFEKIFENLISSKRSQSISKLKLVNQIIKNIRKKGDEALFNYTKKFDKININKKNIKITNKESSKLIRNLDKNVKKAIDVAYQRIYQFHKNQISSFVFLY